MLNIPLFPLGWKFVGLRFFLYSIAGMIIFSGALEVIKVTLPLQDKLLSALLAGVITGAGIILRSHSSAEGTDILSVILPKLFSIRLGSMSLVFNSILLATAASYSPWKSTLYLNLFVISYVIDLVVTGLSQRKAVRIISPRW